MLVPPTVEAPRVSSCPPRRSVGIHPDLRAARSAACTSTSSSRVRLSRTECTNVLGIDYSGGGAYVPPFLPAFLAGLVAAGSPSSSSAGYLARRRWKPDGRIRPATPDDADELARLRWDFRVEHGTPVTRTFEEFASEFRAFVTDALAERSTLAGMGRARRWPAGRLRLAPARREGPAPEPRPLGAADRLRDERVRRARAARRGAGRSPARRRADVRTRTADVRSHRLADAAERLLLSAGRVRHRVGPARDGSGGGLISPSGARRAAPGTCARSRRARPRAPSRRRCPLPRTASPSSR